MVYCPCNKIRASYYKLCLKWTVTRSTTHSIICNQEREYSDGHSDAQDETQHNKERKEGNWQIRWIQHQVFAIHSSPQTHSMSMTCRSHLILYVSFLISIPFVLCLGHPYSLSSQPILGRCLQRMANMRSHHFLTCITLIWSTKSGMLQ